MRRLPPSRRLAAIQRPSFSSCDQWYWFTNPAAVKRMKSSHVFGSGTVPHSVFLVASSRSRSSTWAMSAALKAG